MPSPLSLLRSIDPHRRPRRNPSQAPPWLPLFQHLRASDFTGARPLICCDSTPRGTPLCCESQRRRSSLLPLRPLRPLCSVSNLHHDHATASPLSAPALAAIHTRSARTLVLSHSIALQLLLRYTPAAARLFSIPAVQRCLHTLRTNPSSICVFRKQKMVIPFQFQY